VSARRYQPVLEGLALLVVTFPLAVGLELSTLWFVTPLVVISVAKRPYADYALTFQRPGGIGFHALVSATVFVPYVIGHYLLAHWWFGARFTLRLPPDLLRSAVDQVLLIGLPEEFFFRGYLQTQFDQVWRPQYRLFGANWGIGLPAAAALFALCHVPLGGPGRLIVFFPGLLYGWLRIRTGTIAVPALYHAFSNLLMQTMLLSLSG
jgi:membrane protease YdiL (CAAX protease family)